MLVRKHKKKQFTEKRDTNDYSPGFYSLKLQERRYKERNKRMVLLAAVLLMLCTVTLRLVPIKDGVLFAKNLNDDSKQQVEVKKVNAGMTLENNSKQQKKQTQEKPSEKEENESSLSKNANNIQSEKKADTKNAKAADKSKAAGKKSASTSAVVPKSKKAEDSYFSDAVFIGDSRTEGLILNTGLSNAALYGGKGLNVKSIMTEKVVKQKGSKNKISVLDALKKNKFKKIYIMFGVNELGWAYDNIFIERYTNLIQSIQKLEPDSIIYVQSILPVSSEKEKKTPVYNNKKIRKYNSLLKKMAQKEGVYYLNVEEAVKNKKGVLPDNASTDGVHLNKAYCVKWLDYLKTHTIN